MALTRDGRILGIKDVFLHDSGAYDPYGLTVPINSQCTLLGPYAVPNYDSTFTAVFTNKPIVTPYRGAGRQHGVFVIERLLDIAARELGIDRAEIRRRNFIPPDAFPYNNEIIYQDFAPLEYDSGNYGPVLDKALDMIGYAHFVAEEQPRLRAQGRHVGIGIVCYVEGTGIGPYEGAKVQVQANGKVSLATGIGTQGQGHFTSLAQIVADQARRRRRATSMSSPATPTSSIGAPAPSRAAARWWPATRSTPPPRWCARRSCGSPPSISNAPKQDLVLGDGEVAIAGVPGKIVRLGELALQGQPDARRGAAGHRAGAGIDRSISGRPRARPRAACTP